MSPVAATEAPAPHSMVLRVTSSMAVPSRGLCSVGQFTTKRRPGRAADSCSGRNAYSRRNAHDLEKCLGAIGGSAAEDKMTNIFAVRLDDDALRFGHGSQSAFWRAKSRWVLAVGGDAQLAVNDLDADFDCQRTVRHRHSQLQHKRIAPADGWRFDWYVDDVVECELSRRRKQSDLPRETGHDRAIRCGFGRTSNSTMLQLGSFDERSPDWRASRGRHPFIARMRALEQEFQACMAAQARESVRPPLQREVFVVQHESLSIATLRQPGERLSCTLVAFGKRIIQF